jgi:hypothetical protein
MILEEKNGKEENTPKLEGEKPSCNMAFGSKSTTRRETLLASGICLGEHEARCNPIYENGK